MQPQRRDSGGGGENSQSRPSPKPACLQRGGALKSHARPPPLPAWVTGVGSPRPVPAPQLAPPADLNPQHSLLKGFQRGRSTCTFRIIAYEVKRRPLSLKPQLLQLGKLRTRLGQVLSKFLQPVDFTLLSPEPLWI